MCSRRTSTAERDYSHRSLFDKLGVAEESRVALLGKHDDEFTAALSSLLAKSPGTRLGGAYDLIFLHVGTLRDLARIAAAAKHLLPNGGLWIFHPKGRGASPSDSQVRAAGLAAGLVDNKIKQYVTERSTRSYVLLKTSCLIEYCCIERYLNH